MTADIQLENGRIAALGLEVRACALGQASAALMAAHAIGQDRDTLTSVRDRLADYLAGIRNDPGEWPGLEALAPAREYPSRHASILLAFDAVIAAIDDATINRCSPSTPSMPRRSG